MGPSFTSYTTVGGQVSINEISKADPVLQCPVVQQFVVSESLSAAV